MRSDRGFTLVELLIVLAILGILMGISIANYRSARVQAAETAALTALVAINQAQAAFMQTCGNQHYAPHLTSLGKPSPGSDAPFLSPDLTAADEVLKSGYLIRMGGTDVTEPLQTCTGETPVTSYQATADPDKIAWNGRRFFGTNGDLTIYENEESFTGSMPETGPPTIGQQVKGRTER